MISREILSKYYYSFKYYVFREPVDKIYFRRRDEASQYAEFLFKSKVNTKIKIMQINIGCTY